VSTPENIRAQLSELLAQGSLPRSACSGTLRKVLRPILDSGVVVEERSGAGRRLVVHDAEALSDFYFQRYPDARAFDKAPSRVVGVARFRDSKALANDAAEFVCARALNPGALLRNGKPVDVAFATQEHGVFAFSLGNESPYSLRGPCALVESPVVFALIELLKLPVDLVIYGHGRASNRLLDWIAQMSAPDFTLLHLPDYDPVGLNEFTRLRTKLGERVKLHVPSDLSARFEKFSKRNLLEKGNSQALLRNLRKSPVSEIRHALQLIHEHNAGLEQEALFLEMPPG